MANTASTSNLFQSDDSQIPRTANGENTIDQTTTEFSPLVLDRGSKEDGSITFNTSKEFSERKLMNITDADLPSQIDRLIDSML
jgi:hypothetical protein